ncbi:MAG: RecX family transcriptional regulator [Halobacteriovoraceae bacterium]|nr:RecX family transcriptional regulator [Halobacteriovoraceae bacterium]
MNSKAYQYGIRLVSKQDYPEAKIKNKMLAKGFSCQETKDAIENLKSKNYLNERRFTQRQISKLISKGYAAVLIKMHLDRLKIAISSEEINNHIDDCYQEMRITPEKQIIKLIKSRDQKYDKKGNKKKDYMLRYLLSRGHEKELCEKILNSFGPV